MQNNTSHTPGPWRARSNDMGSRCIYIVKDGQGEVPLVGIIAEGNDQHEANARLIASAPDLLAALEFIFQNAYDDDTSTADLMGTIDCMRETARAAIAKATGNE